MDFSLEYKETLAPLLEDGGKFVPSGENVWQPLDSDYELRFFSRPCDPTLMRNRSFEQASVVLGWDFDECLVASAESVSSDWPSLMQLAYLLDRQQKFSLSRMFCVAGSCVRNFAAVHHLPISRYSVCTSSWGISFLNAEGTIVTFRVEHVRGDTAEISASHFACDYESGTRHSKATCILSGDYRNIPSLDLPSLLKRADRLLDGMPWDAEPDYLDWKHSMTKDQFVRVTHGRLRRIAL